jgi:hypothetical protein
MKIKDEMRGSLTGAGKAEIRGQSRGTFVPFGTFYSTLL